MPDETKPAAAKPAAKTEKPKTAKPKVEKPKAHPTSPVHILADDAVVHVPAGTLRKLGLAGQLELSDEVLKNTPTKCKVGLLRKAGFAKPLAK